MRGLLVGLESTRGYLTIHESIVGEEEGVGGEGRSKGKEKGGDFSERGGAEKVTQRRPGLHTEGGFLIKGGEIDAVFKDDGSSYNEEYRWHPHHPNLSKECLQYVDGEIHSIALFCATLYS